MFPVIVVLFGSLLLSHAAPTTSTPETDSDLMSSESSFLPKKITKTLGGSSQDKANASKTKEELEMEAMIENLLKEEKSDFITWYERNLTVHGPGDPMIDAEVKEALSLYNSWSGPEPHVKLGRLVEASSVNGEGAIRAKLHLELISLETKRRLCIIVNIEVNDNKKNYVFETCKYSYEMKSLKPKKSGRHRNYKK